MKSLLGWFDIVIILFATRLNEALEGCPSQELILPCRCLARGDEYQIWCSHSNLQKVLEGLRVVGQHIPQPVDELILENNNLPSMPAKAFLPLRVMRLMLRYNGLERVSSSWLAGQEKSLMELFIVEPELRGLPENSLSHLATLEAITIQSNLLKHLPNFSRLPKLRHLQVESLSLTELSPRDFKDLPLLQKFHISGSPQLTRLEEGLLQDLPLLSLVNISYCGVNWMHPRAITRLPVLTELSLVGNKITDAGMVGRSSRELPSLSTLRLNYNDIDKLGEAAFVDLPALKKLYISNNKITEIHHGAFHRVPKLRILDLNHNLVRRVHPESFLQHSGSGLEELWLIDNDISHVAELRSLLDALPRLTFLDMSHNNLEAIPFGALRGHATLEQLHLDYNKIHLIDKEAFMAMPALRELRLKNNSLSDILEGPFWNLPALKGLDLSGNFFRRIDASLLANLPSLRKINLSGNDIIKIDPITFLANTLLEQVNLSHNAIAFLHPATFNHLVVLYEVDVSYNRLEEFIPDLPRSVEYLHLSHNRIDHIPVQPSPALNLPALRMLDISGNLIQEIPTGVFRAIPQLKKLYIGRNLIQNLAENTINVLNRLEILDLQENKLSQLHPNSLSGLAELKELNLHDNRLTVLRKEVFQNIPNLKKLNISKNMLNKILSEALEKTRNVEILDASYNILEELPTSLYGLKKMKILNLSNNRIKALNSDTLNSLSALTHLDLSYNSVKHLRKGIFNNLQHLKELHMDNNELEIIEPNAIRLLPSLKSVKLNRNNLRELPNSVFSTLLSLHIVELQENKLVNIANNAFNIVPHLLLLNVSYNQLSSFEDAGLRGVRSLELLDISNNQLRRVTGKSLEKMDWLVELRMDNNQICVIHGAPFNMMPRLKVLTLKNNKMISFSEKSVQKIKGNLAVLDIDENPLVCSCSLLWMRGWLQQHTSTIGPKCIDGTPVREIRLNKKDCSGDEQFSEAVTPGCEAELLSAPGTFGTSQIFSQWADLKNTTKSHLGGKNNIAPLPEESEYFYDEYVDYPYNETITETYDNIISSSTLQPKIDITKSSHYIAGDTPTIYAASKNKSKNPDVPKVIPNSPSSSGFTFFGLPLPNLNLNNLLGSNIGSGRMDDKKLKPQPTAQRKTAIVNKPPSRGTGRVNMNPPTDPEIQTGGFIPVLPGSGGFKPITPIINPQITFPHDTQDTNATVSIESVNVTQSVWPLETSTYIITNTVVATTEPSSDTFSAVSPTQSSFTSTLVYNNSLTHLNQSLTHTRTKLEINSSPANNVQANTNIEVISVNEEPKLVIKNMSAGTAEIEISPNKQSFEDIFKEVIENVPVPNIITSTENVKEAVSTYKTTSTTEPTNSTLKYAAESTRNLATPLSALLIPGGQQPHYRPAGRPSITKVASPHISGSAPLHSGFQVAEESPPMPHRDEAIRYVQSTTEKNNDDDDKSWYFMNYNNTDIPPYVGGKTVRSIANRIIVSKLQLVFIIIFYMALK